MTSTGRTQGAGSARLDAWTFVVPLIVVVLQVFGSLGAGQGQIERRPLDWLGTALLVLGPVLLLGRRRWPVPVLVANVAIALTYALSGYPLGPFILSTLVALVVAVRTHHRLAAWTSAGVLVSGHYLLGRLLDVPGAPELTTIPLVAGWLLVILIGAEVIRITAERRAERLAVQEAEQANRIIEERLRIARELHDVVAHNISLINVQAGAALHLIDTRPEQAKPALAAIKQASKDALVELRSILGVLRQVDEPGPRQPTPGLVRLEELVERARQPDLDVELRIEGTQRPLPSAVDVAAYRIVQEAVTNVLRHARASRVEILVTYTDSAVVLDVVDDGQGFATSTTGARSGLVGMRERVTALDGEFEAGPRPGGGFAVHAEIPAAPVDSTDGSAAENGKGTSAEKGSEENR